MKNTTLITLIALCGITLGNEGYTDTYSGDDWSGNTLTLNQSLDLTLDYWSIQTNLTLNPAIGDSSYWGTRFLYTSSADNPGVNNFFLYLGSMKADELATNKHWANYGCVNMRGFGTQSNTSDYKIGEDSGERIVFNPGTYTFTISRVGNDINITVVDDFSKIICNETIEDAAKSMTGSITKLMTDVYSNTNVQYEGWTKPTVIISTVPEPTTATLSLLALAGLATRRRRK